MDNSSSAEEESDEESDEDGSETEVEDGHGEELVMVDDKFEDEMDKFGYSGLDQMLNSDNNEDSGNKDANEATAWVLHTHGGRGYGYQCGYTHVGHGYGTMPIIFTQCAVILLGLARPGTDDTLSLGWWSSLTRLH
ncbi:hypothetical protein OG21DRAFT_1525845 [Imleria badia]|nr:hypothetical protein OG21DRAFT_1525845 [Imleria badia]